MSRKVRLFGQVLLAALVVMSACQSETPTSEKTPQPFYAFDEPPVLEHFVEPAYPELARAGNLSGEVMVRVLVEVDGSVGAISVIKASDSVFEAAARAAAVQLIFRPAKYKGKSTRSWVAIPYHFSKCDSAP